MDAINTSDIFPQSPPTPPFQPFPLTMSNDEADDVSKSTAMFHPAVGSTTNEQATATSKKRKLMTTVIHRTLSLEPRAETLTDEQASGPLFTSTAGAEKMTSGAKSRKRKTNAAGSDSSKKQSKSSVAMDGGGGGGESSVKSKAKENTCDLAANVSRDDLEGLKVPALKELAKQVELARIST